MNRSRQRLLAWIAAFAMLLGALAPAISRAMSAGEGGRYWLEVCSASGEHWIALSAEEARDLLDHAGGPLQEEGSGKVSALDHCPYCSSHFATADLPPSSLPPFAVPMGPDAKPKLFFVAARPLFAWAAVQPRAPPAATV